MSNRLPSRFTYPFCYTPHPLIVEAASRLIATIDATPSLRKLFAEGKMLGVLAAADVEGTVHVFYAFSGNVSGLSRVEGFVPPIFDLMEPDGHFKREESRISAISERMRSCDSSSEEYRRLKTERRTRSENLQNWIFDNYIVCNGLGERLSVAQVFALRGLVPPGGTGDCAAPKLLQYAYLNGFKPLAMGEFWYGASPAGEVRSSGAFYPSCLGKCGPLLEWMMKGLDVEANPLEKDFSVFEPKILFCDETIVVVDKPSGMLSVPGRSASRHSLFDWLSEYYGKAVYSCHRLDMDTSGVIVYAFTQKAKVALERQFAEHKVSKSYVARLSAGSGGTIPSQGTISLPLSLDYFDRPRQMVDFAAGKPAVTDFELIAMLPDGGAIVRFFPRTGRTHQLRVHAAHHLGLNHPIAGDRLYGDPSGRRLMLHAESITFDHPVTGETMIFSTKTF